MGIEDTKLVFEVAQSFNNSSSYFFSYLIRTLSEFTIASLLLAWLIIEGLPTIEVMYSFEALFLESQRGVANFQRYV